MTPLRQSSARALLYLFLICCQKRAHRQITSLD